MTDEQQPPLWSDESDTPALEKALDQAREEWIHIRVRQGIGGEEETRAWAAYRKASDAYWERLYQR